MKFIEFTRRNGTKFLLDIDSGWEILDCGPNKPAAWANNKEGRNLDAAETYAQVREKLLGEQSEERYVWIVIGTYSDHSGARLLGAYDSRDQVSEAHALLTSSYPSYQISEVRMRLNRADSQDVFP